MVDRNEWRKVLSDRSAPAKNATLHFVRNDNVKVMKSWLFCTDFDFDSNTLNNELLWCFYRVLLLHHIDMLEHMALTNDVQTNNMQSITFILIALVNPHIRVLRILND